jgi:hypothetical protein
MRSSLEPFWQNEAGPYHFATIPPGKTYTEIGAPPQGDAITGMPTGFADLDELTSGFLESALIVLGARPAAGKTALALSVAVLPQVAPAQDSQTLADIRQELSGLYITIQSLRNELTATGTLTTGAPGATPLDRLNLIEMELQRLTSRTEELEFRINRITVDGTNRLGDLEFRICEMDPGCDIGSLGSTPSLGGVDSASVVPTPQTPTLRTPATRIAPTPEASPKPQNLKLRTPAKRIVPMLGKCWMWVLPKAGRHGSLTKPMQALSRIWCWMPSKALLPVSLTKPTRAASLSKPHSMRSPRASRTKAMPVRSPKSLESPRRAPSSRTGRTPGL